MATAQVLTPFGTLDIRLSTSPTTLTPPKTPTYFEPALQHEASFRRTRASKPKVRTGCLTCKLRRVKCDEKKPSCERCEASGRKCDGYPLSAVLKKSSFENDPAMALLLRRTPNIHQGSEAEIRALEFFYRKTAPQLSGFFDADFWTRLVFQVQASDGAIRHAMIALGTLARQQGQNPDRSSRVRPVALKEVLDPPDPNRMHLPLIQPPQGENEGFALMHYNKAIQDLAARIQSPDTPIEVVLLSCILFVSIEFLRGELHPALKHFKGGMSVALQSLSQRSQVSTQSMHRIEQNLMPFFNRIELLSTLLGDVADWEYHVALQDTVPKSFANMRQARDSLMHVLNLSIRFIRGNRMGRYTWRTIPPEKIAEQDAIQKQLERWRQVFSTFVMSESVTAIDLGAAQVLRLQHLITTSFVGNCLRNDEKKTDEWNPIYEQVVDLAEAIEDSRANGDSSSPNFLFDMEIVSPLWLVLIKCRHPITRRRGIDILRRTKRREGLWDSQVAAIVGERMMLLEEKNLTVLDGSELPEECDRLHASHIATHPVSYADSQKHIVTHFYKPDGLDGRWAVLYEEIELS